MNQPAYTQTSSHAQAFETNKVLRNTYALLAMTLLFSAVTAGISMAVGLGHGVSLVFSLIALVLVWFVLPRTANSAAGIGVVFAFTGLLGASLGPMLNHYLSLPNGGMIITQSLAGTALAFFALSAYVLTTRKNFNFLGSFLFIGLIIGILAMLGAWIAGAFFGVDISKVSLAISVGMVLLMSGMILFDTSRIINGGETNYIMATTTLYLDIYIMFTHLMNIIGFNQE